MRLRIIGAALLVSAGASGAIAWQAQPSPQPRAAPAYPAVQAVADAYVRQGRAPGVVAAIGVGDAEPVFASAGAIALDPGAPKAGPDSLWRIYSMTKPVTAMAAMLLIEDGRLKMDQPIAELIPAFRAMRVLASPDTSLHSRPATRPITVRHLLTHTAGLSYNIMARGPLLKEYERLGILPAAVNVQMEVAARASRPATLEEFANRVAGVPLIAEPGTRWSYSIGLDVMGRVIEVASGMSFERFVQTRLFDPLGMRSTYWTVPGAEAGRFATNYAWVGENRVPLDPGATSVYLKPPSFAYGGAGLVSSARDYDRFLRMLANGGTIAGRRVMKAETVRLAMSNLLPAGVTFAGVGGGTGGAASGSQGYGAGGSGFLADVPGGPGKGTYGWGGAAGTIAWVDPVRRLRGTVMVNYFPADKWPLRADMVRAVYGAAR